MLIYTPDTPKVQFTLRLPSPLAEELTQLAVQENRCRNTQIMHILTQVMALREAGVSLEGLLSNIKRTGAI